MTKDVIVIPITTYLAAYNALIIWENVWSKYNTSIMMQFCVYLFEFSLLYDNLYLFSLLLSITWLEWWNLDSSITNHRFSLKNNNLHFNLITWPKKLFLFRIGTSVWISINHLIAWACIISLHHSNVFCKHNSTFYQDKIPCKFSISMCL